MEELVYHPNLNTNDYELALGTDKNITYMFLPHSTDLNPDFIDRANRLKSFRVVLETGTATFRFERGTYWYAYKKIKGKLNKGYVGRVTDFTTDLLLNVVQFVNTEKPDQPQVAIAKKSKPNPLDAQMTSAELAGHGKDDNLIQTSIPDVFPDNWNAEAEQWKRIAATYQRSCNMAWEEVKQLKQELQSLKNQSVQLDLEEQILNKQLSYDAMEAENILLHHQLEKEKQNFLLLKETYEREFAELQSTKESQASLIYALREDIDRFREEAAKYYEQLQQLEWESSRREDEVQGYYFMHEELSEQVFKYRTVIEEFRHLAKGKDKRNHPRFAYLLDFLAAIDKLS